MTGLLAAFDSENALRTALTRLGEERLPISTYTSRSLDEKPKGSPLPTVMFAAGLVGFGFFLWLMSYADVWNYPLDVGGRPRFAWPAFIPIAFELGALCAMAAGFLGYFVACRMPRLYEPIDECDSFREVMRDGWFVVVPIEESGHRARVRALLDRLGPVVIEDIP
ncbi:MAG: DUF3341 domain-containing protein [Acetobacteraceae bacterium]|nr:DUF3341 domain-containing protein [Acetobacteraceae bacterium]